MSAQPSVEELLNHVRERVQARGPQRITSLPAKPLQGPGRSAGPVEFDFAELRRNVLDASTYHAMVGQLNPRGPGLPNRSVQLVKKVMRRSLSWYTRALCIFFRDPWREAWSRVQRVSSITTLEFCSSRTRFVPSRTSNRMQFERSTAKSRARTKGWRRRRPLTRGSPLK
jgi:hypothetical protein